MMSTALQILVTGGNAGVGKQIAKSLYQKGHRVIMAVRNLEKGELAKAEIGTGFCRASPLSILHTCLSCSRDSKSIGRMRYFAALLWFSSVFRPAFIDVVLISEQEKSSTTGTLQLMQVYLDRQSSISQFVRQMKSSFTSLDALINNAAIVTGEKEARRKIAGTRSSAPYASPRSDYRGRPGSVICN